MTAEELRAEIKARNLKLSEVARRCGITRQALNMRLGAKTLSQKTIDLIEAAIGESPAPMCADPDKAALMEENAWLRELLREKERKIQTLINQLKTTANDLQGLK